MDLSFDVIVVGGGHAGVEAVSACIRLGMKVCLVSTNLSRLGYMSCNPSIGGLGKGHMVREIDLLGGVMGRAADATCLQFKRLNYRKGPAVRGTRTQCDKDLYCEFIGNHISALGEAKVVQGEVLDLRLEAGRCTGVRLADGSVISSRAVVITTGTFLNGVMHIGLSRTEGGRVGDRASHGLSDQLRSEGLEVRRLKTGTPPRLFKKTIDFTKLSPQFGDSTVYPFSLFSPRALILPQVPCYLGHTNERTHEVIRRNLHLSPMFTGIIEGVGPRYCPSIEDKLTRFADKTGHQTFLEPEGLNSESIYLQGISTSLPESVQLEFLRTISGLEAVEMIRPGYAVEYDFVIPTQLNLSLETQAIGGLYLAGQINGSSGYEEAAAQGLMAGVNASLRILERSPLVLRRSEAYIGVLIDDLVLKGTLEPYRMMTSRAEHRLHLREDNTIERIGKLGTDTGLLGEVEKRHVADLLERRERARMTLRETVLVPNAPTQSALVELGTTPLLKPCRLDELLRRGNLSFRDLYRFGLLQDDEQDVLEPIEIEVKYSGYIERHKELMNKMNQLEEIHIPSDIDFSAVRGLSREEVEKLGRLRPLSLGHASRISGVNPSAIQCLFLYMKGRGCTRGGVRDRRARDIRSQLESSSLV